MTSTGQPQRGGFFFEEQRERQVNFPKQHSRKGDVIWQNLEGEIVLLNPNTGEYFGLNDVASSFWELIDGTRNLGDIIDGLLGEYEVEREELHRDIEALIQRMLPFNLVILD